MFLAIVMGKTMFVSVLETCVKQGQVFTFVFLFGKFLKKNCKSENLTPFNAYLQHKEKHVFSHFDYFVTIAENTLFAIFPLNNAFSFPRIYIDNFSDKLDELRS